MHCDRSMSSPTQPSAVVQLNGIGNCGGLVANSSQSTTSTTATPTLQDLTTNAQLRNISARLLLPKEGDPGQNPQPVAAQSNYHQFVSPLPNLYPLHTQPTNNVAGGPTPMPLQQTFEHRSNSSNASAALAQRVFSANLTSLAGKSPQLQHLHQQQHPQHSQAQSFSPVPPMNAMPPPPHQTQSQSDSAAQNLLFGATSAPPITILVPYPVLVPVPIPIPIPMPLIAFLRAAQLKLDAENNNHRPARKNAGTAEQQVAAGATSLGPARVNNATDEQPLDFTKSRELCAEDDPEQLIEVVCDDEDDGHVDDDYEDGISELATQGDEGDEIRAALIRSKESNTAETANEPLPKFKITRLNSRRGFITSSSDQSVSNPNNTALSNPIRSSLQNNRHNGNYDGITASKSGDGDCRNNITPTSERNVLILSKGHQQTAAMMQSAASSSASSETSRPLRKRKRVVDGDYSRLKDDERKKSHATSDGASK